MKMQTLSITLFAGILLLNSCSNQSGEQTTGDNPTTTLRMPTVQPASETTAAPDDVTISKTDTGKAKGLSFLIKNITELHIEKGLVTAPQEGEKYIAVQVWLRNTSDAEIDLNREDFKLFDQNDAEFVEKTGFVEHRRAPFMFSAAPEVLPLKPNQSKSGWVTFTTDKESKARKITYENITVNL